MFEKIKKSVDKIGCEVASSIRKNDDEKKNYRYSIAIAAIMKNEGPYVREWVSYHCLAGIEKFYLFDNESTDDTKAQIQDFVEKGIVEYKYVPGNGKQNSVYNETLRRHKNDCKYIAFIDLDEFILPHSNRSIFNTVDSIMASDPLAGGVAVNWRMFGSSGYKKKPEGGGTA